MLSVPPSLPIQCWSIRMMMYWNQNNIVLGGEGGCEKGKYKKSAWILYFVPSVLSSIVVLASNVRYTWHRRSIASLVTKVLHAVFFETLFLYRSHLRIWHGNKI